MREKCDARFTVRVAATIPKALHSRDSADRLVRVAVSLWRENLDDMRQRAATLVLDFEGIGQLSESAADSLIEFRREFSEDNNPRIVFSNMSVSVSKTLEEVERPQRQTSGKIKKQKGKHNGFLIKI